MNVSTTLIVTFTQKSSEQSRRSDMSWTWSKLHSIFGCYIRCAEFPKTFVNLANNDIKPDSALLWNMTPRVLVCRHQRFGEICCPYFQGRRLILAYQNVCSTICRNSGTCLLRYTETNNKTICIFIVVQTSNLCVQFGLGANSQTSRILKETKNSPGSTNTTK